MIFRALSLAAALALLVPALAEAQTTGGSAGDRVGVGVGVYGPADPRAAAVHAQTRETRSDVRHAVKAGHMSKEHGRSLRRNTRRIDAMTARYAANGPLSDSAARDLEMAARAQDSLANSAAARSSAQRGTNRK